MSSLCDVESDHGNTGENYISANDIVVRKCGGGFLSPCGHSYGRIPTYLRELITDDSHLFQEGVEDHVGIKVCI